MTLHNAPDTGPLATTGGAIATLACSHLLAALVLLGVLFALARRYTVCRCEQAREDA